LVSDLAVVVDDDVAALIRLAASSTAGQKVYPSSYLTSCSSAATGVHKNSSEIYELQLRSTQNNGKQA